MSMSYSFIRQTIAAMMLIFLIGGCAFMDETTGDPDVCPMPTILKSGQELVRFRPNVGYDLNKIVFHVKLNTFDGECDIGEKEITLNIALSMTALRGAAMLKDKAEFAYWVWVVDREKKVLTRNRTPVIAKFEGRDSQIDFSDIFDVIIPQRPDHSPPDWRIFIGLELTKEELAYNRRRLGSMRRR